MTAPGMPHASTLTSETAAANEAPVRRKIGVVVPCRNEAKHIERFIHSLLSQDKGGLDLEVIVADGRSDDGTREILERLCRQYLEIRMIDNPSRIVSAGLNAAIRATRAEIILRMDVHTEYKSDYILRSVEALERTGADNVGGACIAVGDGYLGRAIAAAFQSCFAVGGARWHRPTQEGPVDTVHLGCWRRETLLRAGLFDETLVRNQDDELNLRLTRAGGKVWQSPSIVAWYSPRSSLRALFLQYFQYGFWKVAVIRKHRLPASQRHLIPGAFVLANAVALLALLVRVLSGLGPWDWVTGAVVAADAIYAAISLSASFVTARRSGWRLLPLLPLVFLTYHCAYGLGFLVGIPCFSMQPLKFARLEGFFTRLSR